MKTRLSFLMSALLLLVSGCAKKDGFTGDVRDLLRDNVMTEAGWAMEQQPVTITSFVCERSAGGVHDFYSEGDYWWPNPDDPDGPYIRRDGETNPGNFVEHRLAMIRFSRIVGSLASAYILTGDDAYVRHAFAHVNAWFVDPATRMNPSLSFAQAIKGITPGRGIGIIDTIHFIEVVQGIMRMEDSPAADATIVAGTKKWFSDYIMWLAASKNGLDEMNTKNNHAACWVMQTAAFARFAGNARMIEFCNLRYKNVLLPDQMAANGSFPLEIERTKPYGYSVFNLDAMATICMILSTPEDNLWEYHTPDGRNIRKGIEFMYPYIKDKSSWPYPQDVMYWDEWPVAQPALIFAAQAYSSNKYYKLWADLPHAIKEGEVERNVPIRNPIIWL